MSRASTLTFHSLCVFPRVNFCVVKTGQPTLPSFLFPFFSFSCVFGFLLIGNLTLYYRVESFLQFVPRKNTPELQRVFFAPEIKCNSIKNEFGRQNDGAQRVTANEFAHKIFISKVVPRKTLSIFHFFFVDKLFHSIHMMVLIERMPSTAPQPIHQSVERK